MTTGRARGIAPKRAMPLAQGRLPDVGAKNIRPYDVTAPKEAEETWRAYLAMTPAV